MLNEGGIYLDTDVELSSNNIEELNNYSCWFAMEDMKYISTGLGFGAEKNNKVIKSLLDNYLNQKFDYQACSDVDTPIIQKNITKFKRSKDSQIIDNIKIIGMNDYGYYGKHHANLSWASEDIGIKKKECSILFWKFKQLCRSEKIMNFLEKNGETKISKLYIFLVYDLLDYGTKHFILKAFNKTIRRA